MSPDELRGYPEFTWVLIRLEEMIGCSQHRSKEAPDAHTRSHTCLPAHTHTHMVGMHKALVDGNALGHAPSHRVNRHTSADFGFCHMRSTRRQTTSQPSLLSVHIHLPPGPACVHFGVSVCSYVSQCLFHTGNPSRQHTPCCCMCFMNVCQ